MTPLPWNITASACQSTLPKGQTQHGKIWQALADIGRHVLIAVFCLRWALLSTLNVLRHLARNRHYPKVFVRIHGLACISTRTARLHVLFAPGQQLHTVIRYGRVGVCYGVPVGKCFNVPTCSYSTVAARPHWEKSAAGLLSRGSEILVFPLLGAEASHWIDKVTATPYSEVKLAMPHRALKAKRAPHYLKRVQVLLPCLVSKLPGPSEPDGSDAVSHRDCRSFTRTSCSSLGNSAVTSKGEAAKSKKRWCRQCKNIRSPLQWPLKTYTVS